MILDNNPRIDPASLSARVHATAASRRRETLAPAPDLPPLPAGADASATGGEDGPAGAPSRWRQALRAVPVVGPLLSAVLRRWRRVVGPHASARMRLRSVPLIGPTIHFFWALLQLPAFRDRASLSIDLMREQLAGIDSSLRDATQRIDPLERRSADLIALPARNRRLEELVASQTRAIRVLEKRLAAAETALADLAGTERSFGAAQGGAADASGRGEEELRRREDVPAPGGTFYIDFEDRFRGSRAAIADRQSRYLPLVDAAVAGRAEARGVDIGCGRGEWLELLRGRGVGAVGFDLDHGMVESCVRLGLDARTGDGIAWLESCIEGSLDVVTAFQVIEHLDFPGLLRLLDATLHALAPRGVAIFETPNPENLLVGAHTFHIDPSHQRPIPPQTAEFLARQRGFPRVEILRTNPFPDADRIAEPGEVAARLNALLYGPQDYALVVWKTA